MSDGLDPRCGEALPELLEAYGVSHVFGIPGNHTLELYRGLADSEITHVTTRHEQGAGFMADGYARATGGVGVCFLISGPGLLNAATAMGQALADSVPMLVVSAVAATGSIGQGRGELHELPDQQATVSGFCRLSLQVNSAADLIAHVAKAFEIFECKRPGPVHLQIPMDVMAQPMPRALLREGVQAARDRMSRYSDNVDSDTLSAMLVKLQNAQQPFLLCGGGAASAADQWCSIAEALDLPVITTSNAKGLLPPDHPLAVGGSPSLACTRQALNEADVVLAVGTEFGETDFDLLMDGELSFSGSLLRIDIDPAQLGRNQKPELAAQMSARGAARWFAQALGIAAGMSAHKARMGASSAGAERAQALRLAALQEPHWHPEMADFFSAIVRSLGDTCVVGDSTRPTYYATWQYEPQRPRRYFHSVTGFGTLGYAIPAAFGAAVALDEPVVALIGDGGAQFTLPELATAVDNALPVTVVIWANRGYEEIENSLRGRGVSTQSTTISGPDFELVARAYKIPFSAPRTLRELEATLTRHSELAGPSIVFVAQDQFITQPSGQWYG